MDKQTFQSNVLSSEEMLFRVSKSICFYECDCEDAVQQAILKAYEKLDSLRDEKFFRTWITRILINECYRINKLKRKEVSFFEYSLTEEAHNENHSDVFEEIMKLPPKNRIVFQLYYVEGYSVDETAKILQIPSGTVKSRLAKGRTKLKSMLEE